jgi:signal transduction histidine kinase
LLQVRDIRERRKLEEEQARMLLEKNNQQEEMIKTSLRIQKEERNRIAAEMHDEVGAGLSKISVLGQVIKNATHNRDLVEGNIVKILAASKEVEENISQIIWAMDPQNDTLENLIAYIKYYTSEFMEASGMEYKLILPDSIPGFAVIGKVRRNTFLIIKEALNNIIKHAQAKRVSIAINCDNSMLSFIIKDNGNGFDPCSVPRFKNGICNMKKRMADINGTYEIDSKPGDGTAIRLFIPMKGE